MPYLKWPSFPEKILHPKTLHTRKPHTMFLYFLYCISIVKLTLWSLHFSLQIRRVLIFLSSDPPKQSHYSSSKSYLVKIIVLTRFLQLILTGILPRTCTVLSVGMDTPACQDRPKWSGGAFFFFPLGCICYFIFIVYTFFQHTTE